MSMTMKNIVRSFESQQNILAFPAGSLKIACPDGEVREARPNKVARIGQNICSALKSAMVG